MMATLSSVMRIPVAEIYGVASFYALIPVSPRGAVQAHICTDILCQLQNGERLWQETSAEWAPQKVTVTAAHCLGRCEHAPAAMVGSAIVVNATPDTLRAQIREALDE